MEFLLKDRMMMKLGTLFNEYADCSPAPHLIGKENLSRAKKIAKKNGVWKEITEKLDPQKIIPVIKRSDYRQYKRKGNRTRHQEADGLRKKELELAATALWLDHPKADLDYLQDLLWAYCDESTWVMAAHEGLAIDLGSAMLGASLAEILYALDGKIEDEVSERVRGEIDKRLLRPMGDYDNYAFWHTARMNWNHVCNGAFIRAALYEIKDGYKLAKAVHGAIQNLTYALDGFTDDGGCVEGPGYWGFGFGHYVQVAYALHCRTGGELNIMKDEKIERICRYPLSAHISGSHRTCFADSGSGGVDPFVALQINHFHEIPELFELCPRQKNGKMEGAGELKIQGMHSLGLYRGQKAKGKPLDQDYFLPDLGTALARGKKGKQQMTLAAIAGNNGVPHNHNDIGSFLVHVNGRMVLTDPGGPVYNQQTFSPRRYEILFCRSKGHSVPLINGREQREGGEYFGKIETVGFNSAPIKKIMIDMTRAYPKGTVERLVRTLTLKAETNEFYLEDDYAFKRVPKSLEESFVTFEKVKVNKKRDQARIGTGPQGVVLNSDQPGQFFVESLLDEPKHRHPNTLPLQRITFIPSKLSKKFSLGFRLS